MEKLTAYRVKTKEEFLMEFGPNWRDSNFDGCRFVDSMNYLFGKRLNPRHCAEFASGKQRVIVNDPDGRHQWGISKKMVRELQVVARVLTKEEMIERYGEDWNPSTSFNHEGKMDYLLGTGLTDEECRGRIQKDIETEEYHQYWYLGSEYIKSIKQETEERKEMEKEIKVAVLVPTVSHGQVCKKIESMHSPYNLIESVTFNLVKNRDVEKKIKNIEKNKKLTDEQKADRIKHAKTDNIITVKLKNGNIGIAKLADGDAYDEEVGFTLAYARAVMGSRTRVMKALKHFNGEEAKELKAKEAEKKEKAAKKLAEYQTKAAKHNKKKKVLTE